MHTHLASRSCRRLWPAVLLLLALAFLAAPATHAQTQNIRRGGGGSGGTNYWTQISTNAIAPTSWTNNFQLYDNGSTFSGYNWSNWTSYDPSSVFDISYAQGSSGFTSAYKEVATQLTSGPYAAANLYAYSDAGLSSSGLYITAQIPKVEAYFRNGTTGFRLDPFGGDTPYIFRYSTNLTAGSSTFKVLDSANNIKFNLDASSGYTGSGTNFLADNGRYTNLSGLYLPLTGGQLTGDLYVTNSGVYTSGSNGGNPVDVSLAPNSYSAFTVVNNSQVTTAFYNDGNGKIFGTLASGVVTPAQFTSNKNDFDAGTVFKFLRLSSDASRDLTGIVAYTEDGGEVILVNVGSNNIVLKHQSASSSVQNRFLCTTGADITLSANQQAHLWYDSTTSRWRVSKMN